MSSAPQTPNRVISQHSPSSSLASPRSLERSTAPLARWEQTGVFGGVAQEVAFGIVHLFRTEDAAYSSSQQAGTPTSSSSALAKSRPSNKGAQPFALPPDLKTILTDDAPEDAGTILAVLAVPSHMHASDWLAFVESAVEAFEHVRIVRESSPGRCLILIKFRDAIDAEFFHREFNNVPFNAMHPNDLCRVVYVTSITLSPSTLTPIQALANTVAWPLPSVTKANAASTDRERELELPTCPVCLDRMDSSVTGLMTVSCQHSFHCACLSRWEDSRCPVCRYSQSRRRRIEGTGAASSSAGAAEQGSSSRIAEEDEDVARENVCAVCGTTDDLWVCLICAAVGCGRYKGGHAHSHFDVTVHAYSLELETQRVWSYVEDTYVHRLIQSKADGKLVELPSASASSSRDEAASGNVAAARTPAYDGEKLDAMGAEYSMLLTSQLDTQRSFYEEQVRGAQSKLSEALAALDEAHQHSSSSTQREASLSSRVRVLEVELSHSRAAAERSEARALKAMEMVRKLQTDLQGERSVSEGLMRRLEKGKEKEDKLIADVEEIKAQNADLQEQMRDLMFFVSARDKLQEGEAAGGDIEGVAAAKKAKVKKKKK